jgi:PTS system nitrogen regulatory IIA component
MDHPSTPLSLPRTVCRAREGSKKRIFELAALTISADQAYLSQAEVFSALISRERLGSTAMGEGIAIPHCRIANCPEPIGALITLAEPVEFDAPDGGRVDIVFVLLVPEEAHQEHLNILATLAKLFSVEGNRQTLRQALTNEALYDAAVSLIQDIQLGDAAPTREL